MSITNPSPNVLINGFAQANGVDVDVSDAQTIFQLEDAAGVNVWTLECIGADEINTPFLDTINTYTTYINATSRQMQNNTIRGFEPTALQTGTALIFRSIVNNGIDINGNVRDDYVTTFGVFIRTDDGFGIPNNELRVGATNETTEGNEESGWTGKINEVIRLAGQPILATTTYPGIVQLAGDLGGTGLAPSVLKINGTSVDASPNADEVLTAVNSTTSDWKKIVNANIDNAAGIVPSKLSPGVSGQVLMSNTTPTAAWMTIDGDVSFAGTGTTTLVKIRGKNTDTSLASIGATEDGYILKWNNSSSQWEAKPDTGGGGSSVSWAGDLLGSTDITQLVTHITGSLSGSEYIVALGNGSNNFAMFPDTIASGSPPAFRILGTTNVSGNGGEFTLQGGNGSTTNSGGNLILSGGIASGSPNNGGSVLIKYDNTYLGEEVTLASFARSATSITAAAHDPAATLTLNSGTGGTGIYSDHTIGITGSTSVTVTSATNEITANAKTTFDIQRDSVRIGQWGAAGLIVGRTDATTGNERRITFTDSNFGIPYPVVITQGGGAHQGNSMFIAAQGTTDSSMGGPLVLSGGASGTGTDGYVYLRTGNTARVEVSVSGVSLYHLAGSGSGYVAVDNNGLLSFSATANPGGSAGGDLTGTYPDPELNKIKGKTLDADLSTVGASQDGYVLTWNNSASEWQALIAPSATSGVTWANDLAGSSDTNQYIQSISGNAGAGGTVSLNIDKFEFGSTEVSPTITQASTSSGSGQDLLIQAQSATGGGNDGGDIILDGGNSGSSIDGWIRFRSGGDPICFIDKYGMTFEETATAVAINQLPILSGNGANWVISAQGTSSGTGGNMTIQSGSGSTAHGSVTIQTGSSATSKLQLSSTGALRAYAYGVGVIVSDSSGNLTASNGGTGQILVGSATPVPTWTTPSQDISITGAGVVTLEKLRNKTLASALGSVGSSEDGYVLTWVNGSSEWQAKPAAGSGSGLTAPVTASHRAISGHYTVDSSGNDYVLLVSTAAARNITLPTPTSGRVIVIKDSTGQAETNNITLVRAGSEQIEGVAASRTLSTNWGVWTIVSDGTNWYFI